MTSKWLNFLGEQVARRKAEWNCSATWISKGLRNKKIITIGNRSDVRLTDAMLNSCVWESVSRSKSINDLFPDVEPEDMVIVLSLALLFRYPVKKKFLNLRPEPYRDIKIGQTNETKLADFMYRRSLIFYGPIPINGVHKDSEAQTFLVLCAAPYMIRSWADWEFQSRIKNSVLDRADEK